MATSRARKTGFQIRLSEEERAKVSEWAARHGEKDSSLARDLIMTAVQEDWEPSAPIVRRTFRPKKAS